ncbi:helix-turn-helix domain-containing protein [Paraburkholderia fungorum]|uniref:helix-turn-helix domain-containing protein n=1 Tax=Paraburkholderia fungorum TaxID=134537 RepID=UPI003D6B448B
MVKRPSKPSMNHLRAWREFRELSQEKLGELVGTKGNVIGLLESGERGLSDKWLRKLAPHLGTSPGFLLDHDPNDIDTELLQLVSEVAKGNRAQVVDILKTFGRKAG